MWKYVASLFTENFNVYLADEDIYENANTTFQQIAIDIVRKQLQFSCLPTNYLSLGWYLCKSI